MCDSATRPAFIAAPNTARVRMVYNLYSQEVMNVFYWQGDAPLIAADLSGLVDEVHTAWTANMQSHQPDDLTLKFIEATALDAAVAPQVTGLVNSAGGHSAVALPGGTTFALKFATGSSGRSARGRMYWLQLDESQITGNLVNDGERDAILAAMNAFFDAVETATGLTHVVTSYCNGKVWRTTAVNFPVLSVIATDQFIDSQRRRLTGRGT